MTNYNTHLVIITNAGTFLVANDSFGYHRITVVVNHDLYKRVAVVRAKLHVM